VLAGLDCVPGCNARVHLVGHSYGGLVALQFALRHPALVASLTLYDPLAISLFEKGDPIVASFMSMGRIVCEHVAQRRSFEAAQVFFNFWSSDGAFERLSLPSKARLSGCVGQIAMNFQAATRSPVRADVLAQLRARTLLMTGSRSPLFAQRIVAMLARDLPAAKVNWIEGDHMAPLNAPERVHPWIETFLDVQAQNASAA
jgi:pimeloyl-ACP methyl ester carboxylesterase